MACALAYQYRGQSEVAVAVSGPSPAVAFWSRNGTHLATLPLPSAGQASAGACELA